jgi:hypothetical protein
MLTLYTTPTPAVYLAAARMRRRVLERRQREAPADEATNTLEKQTGNQA